MYNVCSIFNIRYNFGKYKRFYNVPNLISIQKKNYDKFLQEHKNTKDRNNYGLQNLFKAFFPFKHYNEMYVIDFIGYNIEQLKYNIDECKCKGMVYSSTLRVKIRLKIYYFKKYLKKDIKINNLYCILLKR